MKLFLLILLIGTQYSIGQTFSWGLDGYTSFSGGGTYTNIDNSGIDLSISGLTNDSWINWNNDPYVTTGINNNAAEGIVHNYQFQFSEPVDVEFKISEINSDSIATCYKDLLIFSGNPIFLDEENVTINGNEIQPNGPITSPWPVVTIKYFGTSDFTITHGDANACNPGKIQIHSLKFSNESVGLSENKKPAIIKLNQSSITIENTEIRNFSLLDITGKNQKISLEEYNGNYHIDISFLRDGIYILNFENSNGLITNYKFKK